MSMTFDQYIQNPMGIANSVISNREMYRTLFTNKLDKILVREAGRINNIENHMYKDTKRKRYIAYIKIPSEAIENFFYDVLIEFTEPSKTKDKVTVGSALNKYNVRFYSNDPSFVFTFTHAFNKNGIFFTDYADKMSQRAIKEKATQKNKYDVVGYVKTLYFAYIIMSRKGLFNKNVYNELYSEKEVKTHVMEADKKIELRIQASQKKALDNKKAKEDYKRRKKEKTEKEIPIKNKIKKMGNIGSSKTTPKVKQVKNSRVITRINKSEAMKNKPTIGGNK